jgi:hypothetical protein
MIKKTFILFLILSLTHCGFSPIYNSDVKSDYEIIISEISGDKYVNNFINNNIKSISNLNSKNKYKLSIKKIVTPLPKRYCHGTNSG